MKRTGFWLLLFLVSGGHAAAQGPYYQGKTIRIVVGYPTGSAHDLWARLIASQLPKHIPGNPATVVQVMPGARAPRYLLKSGRFVNRPYCCRAGC
jgi:tripartite-type tricarboxylate transporter receptor subunit TctC